MSTIRMLFVASNPWRQEPLQLDTEYRRIDHARSSGGAPERIHLSSCWASRPSDLVDALARERPHIVHFSAHATPDGIAMQTSDVYLESARAPQGTHWVGSEALRETFALLGAQVRLLVLNACQTSAIAAELAHVVGCTIGMPHDVHDVSALVFAERFYQSLFSGESVQNTFDRASLNIHYARDQAPRAQLYAGRERPEDIYVLRGPGVAKRATRLHEIAELTPSQLTTQIGALVACAAADGGEVDTWLSLGLHQALARNFEAARTCLARCVELRPMDARVQFYAALVSVAGRHLRSLELRKANAIVAFVQRALQLDPAPAEYHYLAALIKRDAFAVHHVRYPEPHIEVHTKHVQLFRGETAELNAVRELLHSSGVGQPQG